MDAIWQDVRSGVRSLTTARGFTAVAVLVFALGIGINTALFTLTNGMFFRPLPVERPEQLMYLYSVQRSNQIVPVLDGSDYRAFRDEAGVFSAMTGHWRALLQLTADDVTEQTRGEYVVSNYFDVLGVKPARGRTFRGEDEAAAMTDPGVVISDALWQRRFKRDPQILGRKIRLWSQYSAPRGTVTPETFTVIGVVGPAFQGISDPFTQSEFWIVVDLRGIATAPIVRLKDGISIEQGRAAVAVLGKHLLDEKKKQMPPDALAGWDNRRYEAYGAHEVFNRYDPRDQVVPRQAMAMSVVVALVLLIAAANVGGIVMARGITRSGETAIRVVLGASRWRVVRLLLTESTGLALAGGAVGLFVAYWLVELFHAYTPDAFSIETPMDRRVLLATLAICLAAGLVTGFVPALRAARIDLLRALPGTGVSSPARARSRLRYLVVIPQIGLSLALLVMAGFQVRSLMKIETANLGYQTDDILVMNVARHPQPDDRAQDATARERRAARSRAFYRQLVDRLATVRGASGIALASGLPLTPAYSSSHDAVREPTDTKDQPARVSAAQTFIGPRYFDTMGIRHIRGRDFDERDGANFDGKNPSAGPAVAVVNETLAQRLWPALDPLGKRLAMASTWPGNANEKLQWLDVVGVVDDVRPVYDPGQEATAVVYLPMSQQWDVYANVVIARVSGNPEPIARQITGAVGGSDLFAEASQTRMMDQMVSEILYPRRMIAGVLAAAGLIGLLLASIGLYGIVSYSVAQRVQELGVRSALGADRARIIALVLKEGATVGAVGIVAGAMLTYATVRAMVRFPIDMTVDPGTLVVVPVLLLGVVLLACYIPARRAARVDPLVSLRAL